MNQSIVDGKNAIVLNLTKKQYGVRSIEFISTGHLIYHFGGEKQWGKWFLEDNLLNMSIYNSFNVSCKIIDNDIIQGDLISNNGIQDEFVALLYDRKNSGDLKADICYFLNKFYIPKKRLTGFISPSHLDIFLKNFNEYNSRIVLFEIYKLIEKYWYLKFNNESVLFKLIGVVSNRKLLNNIDRLILRLNFLELSRDDFIERLSELNQEIVIIIKLIEQNKTVWKRENISEQDFRKIVRKYENTNYDINEKYKLLYEIDVDFFVKNPYSSKLRNYCSFDDHIYDDSFR